MTTETKTPHRKFAAWEYKIDNQVVTDTTLNKHGAAGWELVTFTPGAGGFPGTAVFKRPVQERPAR